MEILDGTIVVMCDRLEVSTDLLPQSANQQDIANKSPEDFTSNELNDEELLSITSTQAYESSSLAEIIDSQCQCSEAGNDDPFLGIDDNVSLAEEVTKDKWNFLDSDEFNEENNNRPRSHNKSDIFHIFKGLPLPKSIPIRNAVFRLLIHATFEFDKDLLV